MDTPSNLRRRLDALESRMTVQPAVGGQARAVLADRLMQMAQRAADGARPPQSVAERLVGEALASGDFWPAVTRGLRAYLADRRAS